jgi:hypothetical protein
MAAEILKAEYELKNGIVLTVTPVTGFARAGLQMQADRLIPEPDRTPYEVEVPDALIEGTKSKAEQHPEWIAQMDRVRQQREQMYIGLLLNVTVTHPEKDELLALYADIVTAIREGYIGTLAESAFVSDWVVLILMKLAENSEVQALMKIAQGSTPLTQGEFINGLRFFRSVAIPRPNGGTDSGRKVSQDIPVSKRRDNRSGAQGAKSGAGNRKGL